MRRKTRLSKSRYMAGLQCPKRLWLSCHEAGLATPADESRQAIFDMGHEVGRAAHELFPGGVLVDVPYNRPAVAEARTAALLADESVSAIFEAAFQHAGVRVHVDLLERLGDGRFGLREVKGSTSLKPEHIPDVAVQKFVLQGAGLVVPSAELVHIDSSFVRDEGPIDWSRFFARRDVTAQADAMLPEVARRVAEFQQMLTDPSAPTIEPSNHCSQPHDCEFWEHCTAGRSPEWHLSLKRLSAEKRERFLRALRSGEAWVSPELVAALKSLEPPLWYLDFETMAPAIPLYPGTRPFQALPVQWSLHRLGSDGSLEHHEFLAESTGDPSRALAASLLDTLGRDAAPIAVWSSYESRVLGQLGKALPDLADALGELRARLADLLPVARAHVYHPDFAGSFSLKAVAPALAPGFGYTDLEQIADGSAASHAFEQMAKGAVPPDDVAPLRTALLAYCERDTHALVEVHKALRDLSSTRAEAGA